MALDPTPISYQLCDLTRILSLFEPYFLQNIDANACLRSLLNTVQKTFITNDSYSNLLSHYVCIDQYLLDQKKNTKNCCLASGMAQKGPPLDTHQCYQVFTLLIACSTETVNKATKNVLILPMYQTQNQKTETKVEKYQSNQFCELNSEGRNGDGLEIFRRFWKMEGAGRKGPWNRVSCEELGRGVLLIMTNMINNCDQEPLNEPEDRIHFRFVVCNEIGKKNVMLTSLKSLTPLN